VATHEKSYSSRSGEVWPAAADRRSAVTLVGARLVSTAGIRVSNFSPIASKFSHAAACDTADFCFHLRRNRSLCWTNEIKRYTEKQVESTDPAVTSEPEAFSPSECRCFLVCLWQGGRNTSWGSSKPAAASLSAASSELEQVRCPAQEVRNSFQQGG
jgi:hypothetical protein